jgi:Sulfotransferase domain
MLSTPTDGCGTCASRKGRHRLKFGYHHYPIWLKRAVRPAILQVRYLGLKPEDVILASYPRSGSTWLRFLLTESLTGHTAEWNDVNRLIPYVGDHRRAASLIPGGGRLVKTHERRSGRCHRGILLVRDPRDVFVSEYRWLVRGGYKHDLDTFLEASLGGRLSLFGAWAEHTRYWLGSELERKGQMHLARFEDLRGDPARIVRGVLAFMDVLADDDFVDAAVANNTIERSREKEDRASGRDVRQSATKVRFVGEGSVEGWRSQLTHKQIQQIENHAGDLLNVLGYTSRT